MVQNCMQLIKMHKLTLLFSFLLKYPMLQSVGKNSTLKLVWIELDFMFSG